MILNLMNIDFRNRLRKLNSKTKRDLEFLMLLKGNPLQKGTVMAIFGHETIFHISVSISSFCFHFSFGRPFCLDVISPFNYNVTAK